jgi:hypothetical protein
MTLGGPAAAQCLWTETDMAGFDRVYQPAALP